MNDAERELRRRFARAEERLVGPDFAPPHAPRGVVRRTHRRQLATVVVGFLAAVAIVTASVAGATALIRSSEQRVPTEPPQASSPGAADQILDLAPAPDGGVWAATEAGVVRWDLGTSTPTVFSERDGLPDRGVQRVAVATDGTVWAVGDSWVAHYDGTWTLVDEGVDADRLTPLGDLAVGPDGAAWVAGEEDTFIRVDAGGATTYPMPEEGIPTTPWARSIAVDPAGTVWASTFESGVLAFNGEWRHFGVGDGLPSDVVGNIAVAPDGSVWVGGDGYYGDPAGDVPAGGVARFDGSTWTTFTTADGLLSNDGDVAVGPDGDVWVIHASLPDEVADALDVHLPSGLSHYDGTRWVAYPDVPTGDGRGAAVSAEGTVWISSSQGIAGFDGTSSRLLVAGTEAVPPLAPEPARPPVSLERAEGLDPVRLSTSIGEIEFTTWVHPDGEEPPWGMTETAHGVFGGLGPDGHLRWSLDGITWTEIRPPVEPLGWSDRSPAFGDDVVVFEADNAVGRATWDGAAWTDVEILHDPRIDGATSTLVGPHGIVFVRHGIYYWDGTGFAEATEPPDPSLHPGSSARCAARGDSSGWSLMDELGPVAATDEGFIALAARSEDDWHLFPVCEPLVWSSTDGNEWVPTTEESPFGEGAVVRDLAVVGGRIVAVGNGAWVSDDGITWERADLYSSDVLGVAGSARGWISVGHGNTMWFSPDGLVWDGPYERPAGWGDIWDIVGVAMLDDRIIGVGELGSPASGLVVGAFIDE